MLNPVPISMSLFAVLIVVACVTNLVRRREILSVALLLGAFGPVLTTMAYWVSFTTAPSGLEPSTVNAVRARLQLGGAVGTAGVMLDVVFAVAFLVLVLRLPSSPRKPLSSAGPA
jgi:hypothetical protein